MKRFFLILCLCVSFQSVSLSAEPDSENTETAQIATIFNDETRPQEGDYISLRRPFKNWVLECDLDLTNDKRVCRAIQQLTLPNNVRITWRITNTSDGTPFVLVTTNKPLENKMLIMRSRDTGFEKIMIRENGLQCDDKKCQAAFPLTGVVQQGILGGKDVLFSTTVNSNLNNIISVSGQIDGLREVLKVAAENPYISIKLLDDTVKPNSKQNPENKKTNKK